MLRNVTDLMKIKQNQQINGISSELSWQDLFMFKISFFESIFQANESCCN